MTREEFLDRIDDIMCGTSNAERAYLEDLYYEVTKPNWISVEDDDNPIDTGWYIFTTGKIVDVGYYLGGNKWRDVHPTHWMPKPSPPEHIADVSKKIGSSEKPNNCKKYGMKGYENVVIHEGNAKGGILKDAQGDDLPLQETPTKGGEQ